MPDDIHHSNARQRPPNCAASSARGLWSSCSAPATGPCKRPWLPEPRSHAACTMGVRPLEAWTAALDGASCLETRETAPARATPSSAQPFRPPDPAESSTRGCLSGFADTSGAQSQQGCGHGLISTIWGRDTACFVKLGYAPSSGRHILSAAP